MRLRDFIPLIRSALIERDDATTQQRVHILNDVMVKGGIDGNANHGLDQAQRACAVPQLLRDEGAYVLLGFLERHGCAFHG